VKAYDPSKVIITIGGRRVEGFGFVGEPDDAPDLGKYAGRVSFPISEADPTVFLGPPPVGYICIYYFPRRPGLIIYQAIREAVERCYNAKKEK